MDGAHHGRIVPHITQAGQGGEPAEAPELPERGTAVRQSGGVPTAAHQQAHAPAIPEQRGVEVPFDIPQDLLQGIRPARVHPQQFRRERNQASGTEGQIVGNLSDAQRTG